MKITKFSIFNRKFSIYFNHFWTKDPVRRSKWKSRGYFLGAMYKSSINPKNNMWTKILIFKFIWAEIVINIDKIK